MLSRQVNISVNQIVYQCLHDCFHLLFNVPLPLATSNFNIDCVVLHKSDGSTARLYFINQATWCRISLTWHCSTPAGITNWHCGRVIVGQCDYTNTINWHNETMGAKLHSLYLNYAQCKMGRNYVLVWNASCGHFFHVRKCSFWISMFVVK